MVAHNLPTQLTAFVGRTDELTEIIGLLGNPTCRLLTLVGPGGIGKTRLALEASALILNHGNAETINGIHFVPLQPLTSPAFILSTLAEAVGIQFYPGAEPWQQLIDYLRPKVLLLILDNFEHLLDGVELVSDLLANAPNLKILATSRETLNLQEEWLYPVKGMRFPESEHDGEVERYDAVRLFAQSARRARPDFSLDAERRAVLRICKLVEGLPLALEMTAAWLKRLPCHEITQQLERGLDILETPVRNVPPRHRSIRAVFEHSWNLLTDSEREVFPKLSVFRGGFRQEAAEAIAGTSLGVLSALIDKSLLRVHITGRYDMHELVRQYAAEKLEQSLQANREAYDRHAIYYAGFLSSQFDERRYGDSQTALMMIEKDLDNIRLAWEWVVEQGKEENVQAFAAPLIYSVTSWEEAETLISKAVARWRDKDELPLATLLVAQARCAQMRGRYESAWKLNQEALSICRKHEVKIGIEVALFHLSEIARSLGDYAWARQLGEESLAIQSKFSERRPSRTYLLGNLGEIAFLTGDYAEAKRLHEESLAAAQEFGDSEGITDAWYHLGKAYLALDACDEAKHAFQMGLAVGEPFDHNDGSGNIPALIGLAETALRIGAHQEARSYFRDIMSFVTSNTRPHFILTALLKLAELYIVEGQHEQSIPLLQMCLCHPASQKWTKERAEHLIAQLAPERRRFTSEHINSSQLNEMVVSALNNLLLAEQMPSPQSNSLLDLLSKRELEILRLIADGLSNREIAEQRFLAVSTVKWYIGEIYSKLHVTSRTQALARARELKLN